MCVVLFPATPRQPPPPAAEATPPAVQGPEVCVNPCQPPAEYLADKLPQGSSLRILLSCFEKNAPYFSASPQVRRISRVQHSYTMGRSLLTSVFTFCFISIRSIEINRNTNKLRAKLLRVLLLKKSSSMTLLALCVQYYARYKFLIFFPISWWQISVNEPIHSL